MSEEVREYRFLPLSPVHIGSGDVELLDQNRLAEALQFIRGFFEATARKTAGGRSRFERYRARLGQGARREIARSVSEPARCKGEIHALPRNPYTGDVIVAGSAVKGAIRTAVLSWVVNPDGKPDPRIERRIEQERNGKRKAQLLEQLGLGYRSGHTEEDPFRLVEISDASWPAGAVRVDRASLEKLGRPSEQTEGMQIHLERLVSQADHPEPLPDCRIRITLHLDMLNSRTVRDLIRRPIDWPTLAAACNRFYVGRLNAEMQRFGALFSSAERWRSAFQSGDILLRVGRHSHFDSLSVDNLREGWNAARKEPIYGIGSTRTLCELNGGGYAPFGWVVLRRIA